MLGKGLRLYKREKLCSPTAIDRLFNAKVPRGGSVTDDWGRVVTELAFPLRMVCGTNSRREGPPVKFLISVPKKRVRHAVDRALLRRRVREAYRHVRGEIENILPGASKIDVAFIYVSNGVCDYKKILKAVSRLYAAFETFRNTVQEQ